MSSQTLRKFQTTINRTVESSQGLFLGVVFQAGETAEEKAPIFVNSQLFKDVDDGRAEALQKQRSLTRASVGTARTLNSLEPEK